MLGQDDIIIDAATRNFHDTMRRFDDLEGNGHRPSRHGRLGRRGGRAPRPLDHGRRHRRSSGTTREPVLTAIAAKFNGEPCCAWLGDGRRRPLRQDHPQRHRIWRHADDRRDLRRDARRPRHERRRRSADVFDDWNKGRLNSYLIEITGHVLAADDPQDRQAAGRPDPRQGRPEGHRHLVGDRGAAARRAGDRHRGAPSRPASISSRKDERVAAEKALRQARRARIDGDSDAVWPTSKRRCLPARSLPTRRALR